LRLKALSNVELESVLDKAHGACPMSRHDVAQIVADALMQWNDERYLLCAWTVMPSHVHVVFTPLQPHSLASIVGVWKSFTANRANKILRRSGVFWQREYFDRLLRDEDEFHRALAY